MLRHIQCIMLSEQGAALVLAVVVMALLAIMGAGFIALSSTEITTAAGFRDGVAAHYLAEAGAKRAIIELNRDTSWTGTGGYVHIDDANPAAGQYKVVISGTGSSRTISSTGRVNSALRDVSVTVNLPAGPGAFSYSVFSAGKMTIDNNAVVTGSVRSNSSVTLDNNSYVSKDVEAHLGVTKANNAVVGGMIAGAAQVLAVSEFKREDYSGGQGLPSLGINGTFTLNGGRYFVSGALAIENNAVINGDGVIYVQGNIRIDNNVKINGKVLIIAEGDIYVDNNAVLSSAALYAGNNITIDNNAKITGSIVARGTVTVDNNAVITYDQGTVKAFGLAAGTAFSLGPWLPQAK